MTPVIQEKQLTLVCQQYLKCLDYPFRIISTLTDTNTLFIFMLMYINDFMLIDQQLFINTFDLQKGACMMVLMSLPFVARIFSKRPPPLHDRVIVDNSACQCSNFQVQNSFPCINVMNVLVLSHCGSSINTPSTSSMLVLLTSLSCVYSGTHYVSDTFIGCVFGSLVLYLF
jgi:hypothetical protein